VRPARACVSSLAGTSSDVCLWLPLREQQRGVRRYIDDQPQRPPPTPARHRQLGSWPSYVAGCKAKSGVDAQSRVGASPSLPPQTRPRQTASDPWSAGFGHAADLKGSARPPGPSIERTRLLNPAIFQTSVGPGRTLQGERSAWGDAKTEPKDQSEASMTGLRAVLVVIVFMASGAACSTALASPPTSVAPAAGASATAGSPVQFTASDNTPYTADLTLQVSSSPQTLADGTLANPDLVNFGLMFGNGGQFSTTWTPTNRNEQTVYWVAYGFDCSAPTYTCANQATPVRSLNVAGLPLPQPISPRTGASVVVGHDITFEAADSTGPVAGLTLDVSSSPATNSDGTLANADIDSLSMSSSGSTYLATSSVAAETVGTVYWVVYRFDCNAAGCGNVASPVQTLSVVPPPVAVRILGSVNFHLRHPTLRWSISCNVDCHGQTYVRAFVRKHGRNVSLARLSASRAPFSLKNAAEYDEVFNLTYTGRSVRLLRDLVSQYGRVRFDVYAQVTDARGHSSAARRSLYMLPAGPATHGPTPTPPPAACYPLTNSGNCYEPGEYCRNSDHGMHGVAGDGEAIVCEDNNGWRWEPA
jgi:hypothetical protein